MSSMLSEVEGWGFPFLARKAHYFVDGHSLCRKWLYLGEQQGDADSPETPDDCPECRKRLTRRKVTPRLPLDSAGAS
ncbi:MAG: hypothetical protein AMXMBFR23_03300 [Chloroflexota bacterium]